MSCYAGVAFIWNGVASEIHDVSIASINNNTFEYISGSNITFTSAEIYKNPELLFLGATQMPALSFPIEIICESEMDFHKMFAVKDWLFGQFNGYGKLQLCVDGLQDVYFECQIKAENDYMMPNGCIGFSCNVECNSSFAWEFVPAKTFKQGVNGFSTHIFHNLSADSSDLQPVVTFKTSSNGREFSIINKSYNDLTFKWTGLQPSETIVCDCRNGIITSSTGLLRFENFNKYFLRLKKGKNLLEFIGHVDLISFNYKNARRLGGAF